MAKAVVLPMKNHVKRASRRRRRRSGRERPAAPGPPPRPAAPARPRRARKKLIEESRRWLSHHQRAQAQRLQAAQDRHRHDRQLPLLLQPGLPRVPQVGDRGRRVRGHRVERPGLLLRGHHRPALHRLPGRLRHLLGGHQPPEDRARGEVAARAHAAVLAGAARPAARRAGRAAGRAGARRPAGLLLHQQRHRRHRGGDEAGPPLHGQARLHLLRARLPRQVLRLALAHGQGRVPAGRSSRCSRTSTSCPSATPTRWRRSCARRRRWAWRSPAWWWSPCRARRARSCRPTTTGRGCARSARATACC